MPRVHASPCEGCASVDRRLWFFEQVPPLRASLVAVAGLFRALPLFALVVAHVPADPVIWQASPHRQTGAQISLFFVISRATEVPPFPETHCEFLPAALPRLPIHPWAPEDSMCHVIHSTQNAEPTRRGTSPRAREANRKRARGEAATYLCRCEY